MAEFLEADRGRERRDGNRSLNVHDANRGDVRQVRRSSRARVQRRSGSYWIALLHELGSFELGQERRERRISYRAVFPARGGCARGALVTKTALHQNHWMDSISASEPPVTVYFNPWDEGFRANPYPHYRPLFEGPPRILNLFMRM